MTEQVNSKVRLIESRLDYDPLLGFFRLPEIETADMPIERVANDPKITPDTQRAASDPPTDSFNGSKAGMGLRLYTAEEFAGNTPDKVDWLCEPYVAPGAITSIDGKPKTSGKTTFVTHMCKSVLDGKPFMGYPTTKTKVIYLTEQSDATFKTALSRAGLVEREDFFVLPWGETLGIKWPEVVCFAVNEAKAKGAGLLVVDTLSQFAGIRGDGENDAGAALDAARPLQEAAASGLAVVVLRHERKSGGEVGDSGRGSSAFAGAVDLVMSLRRCEGNVRPTIREIHAVGRFHETPNKLAVELTDNGYKALGTDAAVAVEEAKEVIREVLPKSKNEAMTLDEVRQIAGIGRTTAQNAIEEMLSDGVMKRRGKGVRNDAFRYWLTPDALGAPGNLGEGTAREVIMSEETEIFAKEESDAQSDFTNETFEAPAIPDTEERVERIENALLVHLLRNSLTGQDWDRRLRYLERMHSHGKDYQGLAENLASKEFPNLGLLDFMPTAEEIKVAVERLKDGPPHYPYQLPLLQDKAKLNESRVQREAS